MLLLPVHPLLNGRRLSVPGNFSLKWAIIALCGAGIAAIPAPTGITLQAWHLLAIFAATIVGSILRPIPGGAMVLLGVTAVAVTGALRVELAKSVSEAYESRPGPTATRLGTFLMTLLYQCEVIICAIFLTGQASNAIIAKFAQQAGGIELTYTRWLVGAIVPGIVSLLVVPFALYRFFPPEIKETPEAAEMARNELKRMGRMSWQEIIMLLVFLLVAGLWMTLKLHSIHFAVVPLIGIGVLLLSGVLDWADVVEEREAGSVFIWYGGLVCMAGALGETGITKRFAEVTGGLAVGWKWWTALGMLALVYFYVHYAFASITAHVTSMYMPFLIVIIAAGAPPILAVLSLAYISNLSASLTHYGTTPAPIYFGAGYVTQRRWWSVGLFAKIWEVSSGRELPNISLMGFSIKVWDAQTGGSFRDQ